MEALTHHDGLEMWRRILADPGDETLRLVFADWLEENGEPGRAEFIRVQHRLSNPPWDSRDLVRSEQLLTAHPGWKTCPCPECGPEGKRHVTCAACHSTGDLFRVRVVIDNRGTSHGINDRTVVFRDGFIDSVSCELRELGGEKTWHCPRCFGGPCDPNCPNRSKVGTVFVPSAWAAAVLAAFPVTRFVDPSMKPEFNTAARDGSSYDWLDGRRITSRAPAARLPGWLFAEVVALGTGYQNSPIDCYVEFPTAEAAIDALSLAAGRVVRRAVCGEGRTGG